MDPLQGTPIAPTQQATAPTQAPLTVDQLQSLINTNSQTTAQDIQNEPTIAAQQRGLIFGNDPTLSSLQSNEQAKIQELFQHDQMLAQQYGAPVNQPGGNPTPTTMASSAPSSTGAPATLVKNQSNPQFGAENPLAAGYVLNPYDASNNEATMDSQTMKELGNLQNEAQSRRDVLGNVLDNVMSIYKTHLDTEKYLSDTYQKELESKMTQQQNKTGNLMNILGMAGGTLPDDIAKELGLPSGTYIPSPIEKQIAQFQYATPEGRQLLAKQALQQDLSGANGKGMTLGDAVRTYGQIIDPKDIYAMYNQVNNPETNPSGYGYASESPEKLANLGINLTSDQMKMKSSDQATMLDLNNTKDLLQKTLDHYKSLNPLEMLAYKINPGAVSHLDPTAAKLSSDLSNAISGMKASVGGRLSNQEITWLNNRMPQPGDTPDAATARVQEALDQITRKTNDLNFVIGKTPTNKNNTQGGGSVTTSSGNKYVITQIK